MGAADFQAFVTEMIAKQVSMNPQQVISKRDQYHREKLISLSSIIGHLAHQQGAEVRKQLAAMILVRMHFCISGIGQPVPAFQNGLGPNADQKQQYALVFIIKAASLSRDVADLLLQDLHYLGMHSFFEFKEAAASSVIFSNGGSNFDDYASFRIGASGDRVWRPKVSR